MKERSLMALFAVPLLWLVAAGSPPASEHGNASLDTPSKTDLSKAGPGKQDLRALKSACDVIADYLGVPTPAAEPSEDVTVSISVQGAKGKSASLSGTAKGEKTAAKCDATTLPDRVRGRIKTTFVFIPDPTGSALSLDTDRSLDAIRLALTDKGYVPYKANIFPWKSPRVLENESKKGDSKADDPFDASRPGVWLFRKEVTGTEVDLRLLFLIGDSPTAGIVKAQFRNAVDQFLDLYCAQAVRVDGCKNIGQPKQLDIVGPVFSGSVDSLAQALQNLPVPTPGSPPWKIVATSGTTEVTGLEQRLRDGAGAGINIKFEQLAKQDGAENLADLFPCTQKTAILTEGDTVFGRDGVRTLKCQNSQVFYYSRNLLNLRTAYESDKDLMSRIFPKSVRPDQLALHFGFTREPSDALPTYAPENLAVSQQLYLRHLASRLHRQHFSNLIIVGSDNLDSVFLARFFQDANPNLRIGVTDSDILLDREAGSVSLRGVISISQSPTGAVSPRTPELPGGQAFGIYRACLRNIFGDTAPLPSIVSVVGFDGEWPLTVLAVDAKSAESRKFPYYWGAPMLAFLLLYGWLCLLPACLAFWSNHAAGRGQSIRKMLIRFVPFCRPVTKTCVLNALVASDPTILPRARDLQKSEKLRRSWLSAVRTTGVVSLFLPILLALAALAFHPGTFAYPAIIARYFYFGNGVSPILPFAALLLIGHACAWSRVRSCYLRTFAFRPQPSRLPFAKSGKEVESLLAGVTCHAHSFFSWPWTTALAGFGCVCVFAYDMWVSDVELALFPPLTTALWTLLFAVAGILIVNAAARLWLLWLSLSDLLRRLEFHPLRLGFTTLPDRVSWTSIWSVAGTRPTMISLQMSSDYLAALDGKGYTPASGQTLRDDIDAFMVTVHQGTIHLSATAVTELYKLHRQLETVTDQFISELSTDNYWNDQRIEGWTSHDEAPAPKDHGKPLFPLRLDANGAGNYSISQPPATHDPRINELKNQFIALQYAAFIRYSFMQLRNLLGFLVTAITLVFIALNVYPFQPMGTLTNFATFLFVLSAIVVVSMFYQMDRDPLLSRLSNTKSGKLDAGFTTRLLQFGALPTVTFLATHFPPIGQSLVKLVQIIPGLAKL